MKSEMLEPAKQYDLFISYADTDRAWVEGYLLDSLKLAGVTYVTEAAFSLGSARLLEFERAIQQSRRTLLVISSAYLVDGVNQFITLLSQTYGLETQTWPVIPLILQSVTTLPLSLRALVPLKATDPDEWTDTIERLCLDLKGTVPAPVSSLACPYPGMVPFGIDDSHRFFGREQEIGELLERLRLHPFVTVIGPSGSGKSSLVLAGLIPALRESQLFGTVEWQIQVMRPGETPQLALDNILPENSLRQNSTQRVLLVVDQFEELFTLAGAEAVPFQARLLQLVKIANIYLVLTVRADFYPDLMTSLLWQKIQNHRLEVVPLHEPGLRQAILKPAENAGVFVEAALLERLVVDAAGEPGVLPLVQETLVLLWERIERRFLPLRAYEALVLTRKAYGGNEHTYRTGLQVAIARRADAALAALEDDPEKQQAIARRIFLRLVQFGEGRADTRRQQSVETLRVIRDDPNLFDQTLRHLVNCRLLTLSGDERNAMIKVDIAHEALIAGWSTLQQWIIKRREAEQTRRRLTAKTEEWVRLGRGTGGLLDAVELAEADRWQASSDAIDLGYDESLPALVVASQTAIQETERKEQAQQKRELRAARRTTVAVAIAGILAIGVAISSYLRGVSNQITALSSTSEALLASNRDLDALVEALKAGQQLKQWSWAIGVDTQIQTLTNLQQAIYSVKEKNRLEGHRYQVNSVMFSPDGQTIASASDDSTVKLWKRDGQSLPASLKLDGIITSVSFNSQDSTIASSSNDGTIKLWKSDGTPIKAWKADKEGVTSISFNQTGDIVASVSNEGAIKLWKLNGIPLKIPEISDKDITNVSISPNGNMIAYVSLNNTIKLWKTGKTSDFAKENEDIASIRFSPNGKTIAAINNDGTVKLWKIDGTLINTLVGESGKRRTKRQSSETFTPLKTSDGKLSLSFSPNEEMLAFTRNDAAIGVWNLKTNELTLLYGHSNRVNSVNFSPDSNTLVSGGVDNTVRLWDLSQQNPDTMELGSDEIINFDSNHQTIAVRQDDKTVKLRRLNGGELATLKETNLVFNDVVSSPDGNSVVTAGNCQEPACSKARYLVQIWNANGTLRTNLEGHSSWVEKVSFSPDGKMIASTSADNTVKLWDAKDGKNIATLKGHTGTVNGVRFSPNGETIASTSADKTIRLWNLSGKELKTLDKHGDTVNSVSFSSDGKRIASASNDGTIKLWNLDGKELKTLKGHSRGVDSVTFSPDGKFLASTSQDGTIRLWNSNGQEPKILRVRKSNFLGVVFSADSKTLTSISEDGTLTSWSLDLDKLLTQACRWVHDYLQNNSNIREGDHALCNAFKN